MRIATASAGGTPLSVPEGLCPLIETVGTADFRPQLFQSVERMLDAAAAAVYTFGGPLGTRMVIGDWQAGGTSLERHTGEYAGRYASEDPARRAAHRRYVVTTCVERDELPHPGHRALMEEAGFAHRIVTLFPAGRQGWYSLHVLRPAARGGVSDGLLERFASAAPVFGSLIARHLRDEVAGAALEPRLGLRCPSLTAREAAVCCSLLRGRSAPQIAEALGIRVSSVRTYRKRAYAKLGIGSLPELFQRLL